MTFSAKQAVHGAGRIALVGDGLENTANVELLQQVARLFEADCLLRLSAPTRAQLVGSDVAALDRVTRLIEHADVLRESYPRRIAFDNLPGASDVYGHRVQGRFAVIVGNERRGLTASFAAAATERVQIPMHSARINSLNVCAAAAVALYALSRPPTRPMGVQRNADARRPRLLLAGVRQHYELGSAIRSAAAFGWRQIYVEDTEHIWFGVDRARHNEGRAAARSARNDIRLLASTAEARYDADEAIVVTSSSGPPLQKIDLARGDGLLLVLPAEDNVACMQQDWSRLARKVTVASLGWPAPPSVAAYRLSASIAMAECARQVGRDAVGHARRGSQRYRMELPLHPGPASEVISVVELMNY